jgi:RNA polymerase sigma-70 factor (ECF subfamily)
MPTDAYLQTDHPGPDAGDEWFVSFKMGNPDSMKRIFDLYFKSISFFALKILQQDSYAEDIAQQAFSKLWDARDSIGSVKHLVNFLYIVTRNSCISYLRELKVHRKEELTELTMHSLSENAQEEDPEFRYARIIDKLGGCLDSLPHGNILRMRYLEGRSNAEIAGISGISLETLYRYKSRALKALRECMKKK